jgi:O-antigen ligase
MAGFDVTNATTRQRVQQVQRAPRQVVAPARAIAAKPDTLRWSLAALIVFEISRVHGRYAILAVARPLMLLTVIALVAAFMNTRALAPDAWWRRPQVMILIGLAVVAMGSIPFGISPGGSFYFFRESFSKTVLGALLLTAAIRGTRDLRFFIWAYVIASLVLVWLALFVFEMSTSGGVTRLSALDTWDANDLGVILLVGLPLCGLLFQTSKGTGKAISAITLLGIGAAIARSGSRGGFLGFVAVLAAYLFSLKGTSVGARLGIVAVIVGGLSIAAPSGYWEQMQTILKPTEDYNWDARQGRRQIAIRAMGYMMGRPAFGIGIDNFGRAEATISDFAIAQRDDPTAPGIKWSVAHNSYLQAGAELGIPGLVLFAALVAMCAIVAFRVRKQIPEEWRLGSPDEQFLYQAARFLPIATLGFAVPAYFVTFTYNDPIYILTAMTSGLPLCVSVQKKRSAEASVLVAPGGLDPRLAAFGRRSGRAMRARQTDATTGPRSAFVKPIVSVPLPRDPRREA